MTIFSSLNCINQLQSFTEQNMCNTGYPALIFYFNAFMFLSFSFHYLTHNCLYSLSPLECEGSSASFIHHQKIVNRIENDPPVLGRELAVRDRVTELYGVVYPRRIL